MVRYFLNTLSDKIIAVHNPRMYHGFVSMNTIISGGLYLGVISSDSINYNLQQGIFIELDKCVDKLMSENNLNIELIKVLYAI